MTKNIFLLFFFYSFFGFSQSNEYQFKHLSTLEGLSQSSVIAIEQDSFGQIWFGTRDGLNKFDGNSFTIYRNTSDATSISNNDILSILEDSDGFIWVGTYNGLNKYNPKTDSFKRYFHNNDGNSLSNNTIWTITEMQNGEIWFGTSNGLSIYNKAKDSFTNVYPILNDEKSIAGNHILSILEAKNNTIWIGTKSGLSKLISSKNGEFIFENYGDYQIQDLAENEKGEILIASKNNGVLFLNSTINKIENYLSEENSKLVFKDVRNLVFDNKGALWIGTYQGLNVLDKNNKLSVLKNKEYDSKSLSKNTIKSIFKDKKGSIWIGAYYGGINLWDDSNVNFTNFSQNNRNEKLSYNVISSIQHYKNLLFFGTEGGGITIYNKEDNSTKFINQKEYTALSNNNIKSLLVVDKHLFIGTLDSGIAVYDIENNRFKNDYISTGILGKLKSLGVYAIEKGVDNSIWIGTFGEGVFNYNLNSKKFASFKNDVKNNTSLSNNLVRTITVDSENNTWIGTQRGLNKIDKSQEITRYFYNNEVQSGDDITSIFEDISNTIWVGTKSKGLFKLINNSFVNVPLKVENGFVTTIHSILQDDKKNLWISSNEGILKYNIDAQTSVVYNQKDGVISNEFNDNTSLKIGASQFYFGGPNGVTSFNTNSFMVNNYSPQVLITDFKIKQNNTNKKETVLEETTLFTEDILLSHSQGNFTIQFAIPNFINSNNNTYKYRLKGLEEEWTTTSNNIASYTIQNSGNYTFEVKGANNDGIWNEKPTTISIKVKPAPWRSWWAFLLYAIIIATALYFLISGQQSKTRLKHKLDLELLENEKIEEANKAKLEFFTNISHEFRTPLTLILGPLNQILQDYKGSSKMYKKLLVVENSGKHLLQLINRLMDFRKLEKNLYQLESAEGNIVKFLQEIFLSFTEYANDGDYEYTFHTTDDEILVYYDRYKLERVFYNLISNAFRYTPKNGKISIRIKKEENDVIISVEDNGIGISKENQSKIFERFFEIKNKSAEHKNYNKGTGIGLSIAKNIVKLHKGEIAVESNKNEKGSVFSVALALGRAHLSDDEIIKDFKFSDDVSQYVIEPNKPIIFEDELTDAINDKDKPTILLVEDSKPLRKFMKSILKETYNILEAENGKIALKMAQKYLPNLIVSDVIMPVMVGTELCTEIKNNIKTSHIPVILLTSRSSLIYKLEGLESGADDYISKPFDVNEFQIRIKNLLQTSNRLKEKYAGENDLNPSEVIISSLDEKLYKKALEIVENNISNESFDIPFFCSELGVSRTMLFIKIKAWTNFTPNDFIQHFRMKRAAQLLEQGKINISEVSYKVGFKNPKYFSKCFLKKYGETPTQYSNKFFEY
ncbi:response regulator [Polaribacter haliotis]|uniref:histidine kinase n=1 Tax=Polaribacter haliotis TaxID=1888915 RepID=A0A7L8AG19_9FLAO|nr:two-component regulator propeller domain-containing protein [Polaribacter haliotis]QOD60956.1 response regulator [Polaribacter haliotis]